MEATKSLAHRIAFTSAVCILVLGLVPVALAAKGGNGNGKSPNSVSGSSLTLEMVADANGDGLPSWGDTVKFSVTNPPANPNVELLCSQDGAVVYSAQTGYYSSTWPLTTDMTLRSTAWSGGAASCTARLYVFSGSTTTTVATLPFTAGA
jgi:hypothetical protein